MSKQRAYIGVAAAKQIVKAMKRSRGKLGKLIDVIVIFLVIVIAWGLFSLPIVFYYLSPSSTANKTINDDTDKGSPGVNVAINSSNSSMECTNVYTGTHCLEVLKRYQVCEDPEDSEYEDIYISNTVLHQSSQEEMAGDLLYAMDLLVKPSDECRSAVVPFLCLYMFGLCGSSGDDYHPTQTQCLELRDSVCQREWEVSVNLLKLANLPSLPDCYTLGNDGLECNTNGYLTNETECTVKCHHFFYCQNNFCKPRCDRFTDVPASYTSVSDAMMIASASIGFLAGIAVLVIFVVRRKTLLKFPTVLVFYVTAMFLIVEVTVLISFMDNDKLFCSSIDLIESVNNPSPFCIYTGVMESYIINLGTLWWLFNIGAIFWKIQFPFHSRYYDKTNRTRYVHVTSVILALLLPVIAPVVTHFKGGFGIARFPPVVCVGRDVDVNFYTLVLPASIAFAIGTTMLLFIFWKIRKHMSMKTKDSRQSVLFSPAEWKILVVFIYYLLFGALQLTTFSIYVRHIGHNFNVITEYLKCHSNGDNDSCVLDTKQNPFWALFAFIVLFLFPLINLYFAMKFSDFKRIGKIFCCNTFKHYYNSVQKSKTTSSST